MQKKRQKNSISKGINNASSMIIFIAFFAFCIIIAGVIGIYSVKKMKQKETSGTAVGEITQEQSEGSEMHGEESSDKAAGKETDDISQSAGKETTAADTQETQSNAVWDIIFENCGSEGVLVTMLQTGGWGDENDPFLQYDIVVNNTTDTDISDWCIKIKAGADAACNNIWNGIAELENGVITITPADFNGTIVSGTQASLGIIIEKPDQVTFENITFR